MGSWTGKVRKAHYVQLAVGFWTGKAQYVQVAVGSWTGKAMYVQVVVGSWTGRYSVYRRLCMDSCVSKVQCGQASEFLEW